MLHSPDTSPAVLCVCLIHILGGEGVVVVWLVWGLFCIFGGPKLQEVFIWPKHMTLLGCLTDGKTHSDKDYGALL